MAGEKDVLLRVLPGEEARLTPDGPTAAVLLSRGALPLRPRTEGRPPLRVTFPGTAVRVGEKEFEVVGMLVTEDGMAYELSPWPADHVQHDRIVYTAASVRSMLRLRESIAAVRRARRWSWLLYPLVGLLPESAQVKACARLGLDPAHATALGGLFEALAWLGLIARIGRAGPNLATGILALAIAGVLAAPALLRTLGALLLREVSGSWPLMLAAGLVGGSREEAALAGWLSRAEFSRLVALPDTVVETGEPGVYSVTSALPHVAWEPSARLTIAGERWLAYALPPTLEGGALRFSYGLAPLAPSALSSEELCAHAASLYRDTLQAQLEWRGRAALRDHREAMRRAWERSREGL